jgi:DNA-binding response OmpR family regulator
MRILTIHITILSRFVFLFLFFLLWKIMSDEKTTPWVIELESVNAAEALRIHLDRPYVLGRIDQKQNTLLPDIDLTPYGADEFGVSRRHLQIYGEGDHLIAVDLNSGNGTLLNGQRMEPEKAYTLKHQDNLQLGRLKFDLKVVISPNKGSVVQAQPSLQIFGEAPPGKGQLVLIVDDHPEVAKVISLILEREGYTTATSRDIISAMRVFNQRHPSAVILDLMLPDMNGLEFCRYIRRDTRYNSTPIIIVSALNTPDNIDAAMKAGAQIFLGKPVSIQELRAAVSSLISQHERGVPGLQTRHLVGTAPLQAMAPESRRNSIVLFVAGHDDAPITLNVNQPVTFGRSTNPASKQHVDLSRYNAIDKGVSRIHMTLYFKDDSFYVEDNSSINGTFVDGEPLKPGQMVKLHNANEVRLGELRLYAYFLTDTDQLGD